MDEAIGGKVAWGERSRVEPPAIESGCRGGDIAGNRVMRRRTFAAHGPIIDYVQRRRAVKHIPILVSLLASCHPRGIRSAKRARKAIARQRLTSEDAVELDELPLVVGRRHICPRSMPKNVSQHQRVSFPIS